MRLKCTALRQKKMVVGMDIGTVNHEVAFCKVYDMATKEKVERILLKNRISYYVEWEDKGLGGLFLFRKPKDKTACVFRIHSDEVTRARELLKSVLGSRAKEAEEMEED